LRTETRGGGIVEKQEEVESGVSVLERNKIVDFQTIFLFVNGDVSLVECGTRPKTLNPNGNKSLRIPFLLRDDLHQATVQSECHSARASEQIRGLDIVATGIATFRKGRGFANVSD